MNPAGAIRSPEAIKRIAAAIVLAAVAAVVIVVHRYDPSAAESPFPSCLIRQETGFPCPGCGSTRALFHLLQGDFGKAVRFNLMTVLYLPLLLYAVASSVLTVVRRRGLPLARIWPAMIWIVLATGLLFWVARNQPWYPYPL